MSVLRFKSEPYYGGEVVSEHPIRWRVMQFCITLDISIATNARTLKLGQVCTKIICVGISRYNLLKWSNYAIMTS